MSPTYLNVFYYAFFVIAFADGVSRGWKGVRQDRIEKATP